MCPLGDVPLMMSQHWGGDSNRVDAQTWIWFCCHGIHIC